VQQKYAPGLKEDWQIFLCEDCLCICQIRKVQRSSSFPALAGTQRLHTMWTLCTAMPYPEYHFKGWENGVCRSMPALPALLVDMPK
jgi:hypothetical protein